LVSTKNYLKAGHMKNFLLKMAAFSAAITVPITAYEYVEPTEYEPNYQCYPSNSGQCYPDYANDYYQSNYTGIAYEDGVSVARLTTMIVVSVAVIAIIAVILASSTNCGENAH